MRVREFFRTIQWGATLQLAAIRIAIASVLWSSIMVIFGDTAITGLLTQILASLFFLAACVAVAIPAIGLVHADVSWAGLFALPAWLIVIADPLVKLLHSSRPELVPVDEFKFFNPPVLAIFGTEGAGGQPAHFSGESKSEAANNSLSSDETDNTQNADSLFEKSKAIFEDGSDPELAHSLMFQAVSVDPNHIAANALLGAAIYDTDAPNKQAIA